MGSLNTIQHNLIDFTVNRHQYLLGQWEWLVSAEQGKQVLYFELQEEQAKSWLLVGHYQMHASAELVVADHKMKV